ncbi:MAG: AAA family ATPase [Oscillospiraceae bacterium]|jgi:RecA-family ATPase|nr:AAA family ATPase [Oscillospiraceae bacterium]
MNPKTKEHKRIIWNTVQPKEITWLWQDRIPFGKITILVGDSGLGKTSIALDIAARLTTGRPMPLSDAEPIIGSVLFQSQEDDLADTLLPRCMNASADSNKIISIEAADLNIDEDCDIIEQHIQETGARLAIFDPLQSYMGKNADMCRITDIRRLLSNLGGIAARNDCAVIIIAHQNKAQGAKELHRVFGSVDITATARSVLRISASESDPETRIISHIKSSVSRPGAPIAFRIEDKAPILYLGEYDGDFEYEEIPDDSGKRAKATEIIYAMLKDAPQEGTEIYKACEKAGISPRTVERVKKELNVRSGRDGNKRVWMLP